MNKELFNIFVEQIEQKIRTSMDIDRLTDARPEIFESIVKQASQMIVNENNYNCEIDYNKGGHRFPDIVYTFENGIKFGIEVKSSTNKNMPDDRWTTLGNSILGSTRIDVEDVYIIFIKINKNGFFIKSARYEDSVSEVVVTHSPRYALNLSQSKESSFFAKSGISYNTIKESSNPIRMVTDYFREQGQTAWWIAESTPAIIKSWDEIDKKKYRDIFAKAFVLFPELLGLGSHKYKRFAKWLVVNYSIVDSSLRDQFSAGGKVTIKIDDEEFVGLPRVYEKLYEYSDRILEYLSSAPIEELQLYWSKYHPQEDADIDIIERYEHWYSLAENEWNELQELRFIHLLFSKIYRP